MGGTCDRSTYIYDVKHPVEMKTAGRSRSALSTNQFENAAHARVRVYDDFSRLNGPK